jgi:hypothetical protein
MGRYNIDVRLTEPIYFRQLAYSFFTTTSDSLLNNKSDVYLNPIVIELDNVVILPFNAQNILEKALKNLIKKMEIKKSRAYQLYLEKIIDTEGEREIYALLNTLSNKRSSTKINWDINLLVLDKTKDLNKHLFYYNNRPIVRSECFPQEISLKSKTENIHYELYDTDDEYYIIRTSPKEANRKQYRYGYYKITKQDTVLVEVVSQSLPDISEIASRKRGKNSYAILNHFSSINFSINETTDEYYIQNVRHIYSAEVIRNNIKRNIKFKATSFLLNEIPDNNSKVKKKIKPYDYVLFDIDFPETPGFWKQLLKP